MKILSKSEIIPSKGKYFHEKVSESFNDYCRTKFSYKIDYDLFRQIDRDFDECRMSQRRFGISLINHIYKNFSNFEMNSLPCSRYKIYWSR